MHSIFKFVFWVTLILYILTLCTVSYVGVYLTYIAIPIIVVSGLIMRITSQKKAEKQLPNNQVTQVERKQSELAKATSSFINEVSNGLDSINNSLEKFNEKMELIKQRTALLQEERHRLKIKRIEPEIRIKYAKNQTEIDDNKKILKYIDVKIKDIEEQIAEVKMQCELEVEKRHFSNS